jgi:hypothetical protein
MKAKHWLIGIGGALALAFAAGPSQAAPATGPADGLKAAAGETSAAEQVHWRRRCWRHRGHWHCRRHWGYRPYYYGYGYGPGFGIYVGPRRHWRW